MTNMLNKPHMDRLDKKILNLAQSDFPLNARPFKALGKKVGISEDKLLLRLKRMKKQKLIRRIGSTVNTKHLGFSSTLVAIHAPQEKMNKIAKVINAYKNVTHNYQRAHYYNMWFTLTANTRTEILKIISKIKKQTSVRKIMELPSMNVFKRKVVFKF